MHPDPDPDARRAWPDDAIGKLAARQATMVSREQLLALRVAARTIGEALSRGRLYSMHRGVYSLVPPGARPPRGLEWAALLACGPGAVLSHRTAARLHGLPVDGPALPIELTLSEGDRGRRRSGLCVHRTRLLLPRDVVRLAGLRVTTIPRVVIDLAAELGEQPFAQLLDRALARTSRGRMMDALDRHAQWPGVPRIRALLDPARPSADAWSVAEERLLSLIRSVGLPTPEANVRLGDYVPDLLWREQRLIVEFDSWSFHGGPRAFQRDRERHNALVAEGYQVIRVTWRQLTEAPEKVLVWIATALARSGA